MNESKDLLWPSYIVVTSFKMPGTWNWLVLSDQCYNSETKGRCVSVQEYPSNYCLGSHIIIKYKCENVKIDILNLMKMNLKKIYIYVLFMPGILKG